MEETETTKEEENSDNKQPRDILKEYGLTPKQELFCQHYVSPGEFYGNGVQAYAKAYGYDLNDSKRYNAAKFGASENLTKPNVNKRINGLLSTGGFNKENADKRLLHWMNQNNDGNVSLRAIQEFNKLKARITEKIEHKHEIVPVTKIVIKSLAANILPTDNE